MARASIGAEMPLNTLCARAHARTSAAALAGNLRALSGRAGVPLDRHIEGELAEFLEQATPKTVASDDRLEEAIRKITRQVSMEEVGKKPEVTVTISRLTAE